QAAITHVLELREAHGDFVPRDALRSGFMFRGEQVSFSSFQKGIHRAKQMRGPAALSLFTTPPREGKPAPYADEVDVDTGLILYHYRAGSIEQADNRALRAAHELRTPLIYFKGISPSRYFPIAPVFVADNDAAERCVLLEVGVPLVDVQPGGPVSPADARVYALRLVKTRLHQQRFRHDVLRAYQHRCTICALRERELVQAAHIVADPSPEGIAAVVNGLALCAIHHLAYDRNLLGIDPTGTVHIARRLRDEHDGPMLREGLQGFHGTAIRKPRLAAEHPDPDRLAVRFGQFESAAA
ncbi:MAG TPA: HNH endonuclease, partial [Solirubrobacteraceae bacterium]|nr:HNH endonuclease [Solirubrobacteraceae bacterium]